MPVPINELGEFILADDDDLARRKKHYASCVNVDPKKARLPKTWTTKPKGDGKPETGICAECGEPFEKKRCNQRFCSKKCQKKNYKAEQREIRKLKREMRL